MLKFVKYFISLLLVAFSGLLQLTNIPFYYGVKPNLTLALILGFSEVERSWARRAFLILVGALFLKFYPGIDIDNFIFIAGTLTALLIVDLFPWQRVINIILAVSTATLFLNLGGFSYKVFLTETLYNLVLTGIIIWLVHRFYEEK